MNKHTNTNNRTPPPPHLQTPTNQKTTPKPTNKQTKTQLSDLVPSVSCTCFISFCIPLAPLWPSLDVTRYLNKRPIPTGVSASAGGSGT